jgi:hypothetical protein
MAFTAKVIGIKESGRSDVARFIREFRRGANKSAAPLATPSKKYTLLLFD